MYTSMPSGLSNNIEAGFFRTFGARDSFGSCLSSLDWILLGLIQGGCLQPLENERLQVLVLIVEAVAGFTQVEMEELFRHAAIGVEPVPGIGPEALPAVRQPLEHDAERWNPVFRKHHAATTS